MLTKALETERTILRPLMISDADEIFKNWTNDPITTKYMMFNTHETVNDTREWLVIAEKGLTSDTNYDWGFILKETGEIFGSGGFSYVAEKEMFELGYIIMKKYWNKGLTTEIVKAMIEFAFNEVGLKILCSNHVKENIYSGKVMEKVGFVYSRNCEMTSFDGKRIYEAREYLLIKDN